MENENPDRWCFAWTPESVGSPGMDKAALLKATQWAKGTIITVSFLDGDPTVQQKVAQYAQEWTKPGLANLTLDFRKNTNDTMIRISFRFKGSWSVLGKTCLRITDKTPAHDEFRLAQARPPGRRDPPRRAPRVRPRARADPRAPEPQQRHRVGPRRGDPDLSGPPNKWTLPVIESNMFQHFAQVEVLGTPVDKDSIMMYPIPKTWTKTDSRRT